MASASTGSNRPHKRERHSGNQGRCDNPGVVVVEGTGLASIAGDEDGFGFGGGWIPPTTCETFDNRGPEDLGVFDQRQPSSQYNSICTFVGSWQQAFTVPPGGVGQFTVQLRILGGSTSPAFCFASPCGCTVGSPTLVINGVQQNGFFSDPGCAQITVWSKTFQAAEAAALAGGGTLNFEVHWNNQPFALDWSKVVDVQPIVKIKLLDGDGQKGIVKNAPEKKLRVQVSSDDPSFNVNGVGVSFTVKTFPPKATGYAVGANDKATNATYTAMTDDKGIASAVLVFGDVEGAYTVEASTGLALSNVTFTETAQKPDAVAILKDSTDITDKADTYAVSADNPTSFFAVGLDKSGQKIGPLKCDWSLAASGSGATRGAGAVAPPTVAESSTVFTPSHVGQIALSAKASGLKGVTPGKADLYVTSLYVSVDNNFSISNPVDQREKFVPGQNLDGTNVSLDVMQAAGQFISLHVLTGPGAKGKVTFAVDQATVSHFPGVAMNFPVNNPSMDADMALAVSKTPVTLGPSIDMPFASDGDTSATLVIADYGARGTINITVTAGRSTYAFTPLALPLNNGKGLPAAGWTAAGGVHIDSSGLDATGDDDPAAGSAGSDAAVVGDGLSNYEEFRGFVMAGSYTRLNPREKDIFALIDPDFILNGSAASPINVLGTLQPRMHYIDTGEAKGIPQPSRGLTQTQAIVDPNRGDMPVAHTRSQRAVRLIYQASLPPAVHLAGPNIDVPVWEVGILGATASDDILDIDVLNAPGNVGTIQTPMRSQFSELYPHTFTNLAVNTTFSYPVHYDANGNVVPQCTFQGQTGCDIWDTDHNLIIPSLQPGGWAILYTVPDPAHDPVEHYSLQARDCGTDAPILGGLTTLQMELLKGFIAAHEMGHAMQMDHLRNYPDDCGDLMFDTEAAPPNRRAMSNYVPQPMASAPPTKA